MQIRAEEFLENLATHLLAEGWQPLADVPRGSLAAYSGAGSELVVYPLEAMTEQAVALATPTGKAGHRLDLYVTDGVADQAGRAAVARGARRSLWGKRSSVGLLELQTAVLTLGKPIGWFGHFQPHSLQNALHRALIECCSGLRADLAEEIAQLQQFSRWFDQVKPFWTWWILGLCLLLFGWLEFQGGSQNVYNLYRWGALWKPAVVQGDWWRLASATVLHIGWLHLAVNLFSLVSVGKPLEAILGRSAFLFLYVGSALGGALASSLYNPDLVGAGASGAIFGLAGATVVLARTDRLPIPQAVYRSVVSGLMPAIGYNLIFGMLYAGIDNAAHLGGLVSGALLIFFLYPRPSPELRRPRLPKILWLGPSLYGLAIALSLWHGYNRPLPMTEPLQFYGFGGAQVGFGREFHRTASQGVQRVYKVPGCGLVLASSVSVKNLKSKDAYLAELAKANAANLGQPLRTERLVLGERDVFLSVYAKTKERQEIHHFVVLDSAPDLLEILIIGDSGIQRQLVEQMLMTLKSEKNQLPAS